MYSKQGSSTVLTKLDDIQDLLMTLQLTAVNDNDSTKYSATEIIHSVLACWILPALNQLQEDITQMNIKGEPDPVN